MRISDWSSDLCSSDLLPVTDEAGAIRALPIAGLRLDPETITALRRACLRTIGDLADRPTAPLAARFGTAATDAPARLLGRADSRLKIGRAPCRERVCQYV